MHQFYLLYMPSDTLYGNKYKYNLSGIDDTSKCKVTRPLKTKQATYRRSLHDCQHLQGWSSHLSYGSELKGDVTKLLEKREIKIR